MNQSFMKMFPLPAFLAGSISGILFYHGIACIAFKIDIEKAEPVFHFYGTGFALGVLATGIVLLLAFSINSTCFKKSNNHQIKIQEVKHG